MMENEVTKPIKRPPTHPGEVLSEVVLSALDLSVSRAAREMGVSRVHLHRILAGKAPVSAKMAVRLGKFCGNGPRLWLNMQAAYDLWHAERELAEEVGRIPTHKAA